MHGESVPQLLTSATKWRLTVCSFIEGRERRKASLELRWSSYRAVVRTDTEAPSSCKGYAI